MLNFRSATLLILLTCGLAPLTFYWATAPSAAWYRPYLLWLTVIVATWLWHRRAAN